MTPAIRFRCPKCGRTEHVWDTDLFDLTYERADNTQHVGERLRVECQRCHYVGYEDCADAPGQD